jgi:hypothetical protein
LKTLEKSSDFYGSMSISRGEIKILFAGEIKGLFATVHRRIGALPIKIQFTIVC